MSDLSMRLMRPQDVPAVAELARAQNERDGTSYPLPDLFGPNAELVLVTERAGQVEQAAIFLRTLELMTFGRDPRATVTAIHHSPAAFWMLRQRGYEDLHVFTPQHRAPAMQHRLALGMGLERVDDRLAHFFRNLKAEVEP